jgi:hypothetical protein
MTQVSRPFQIALAAMVLLAAVWFFALRPQSGGTSGSGSPPSAPAPTQSSASGSAASQAKGAASPTPVYHGAAPGVEGLTRAIAKAHEAVAASQQAAKQFEHQSASGPSSPATGAAAAKTQAPTSSGTKVAPTVHKAAPKGAGSSSAGSSRIPAGQALVERELAQGAVVAVLFWNPKASVDVAVRDELQLLNAVHRGRRPAGNAAMVDRLLNAQGLELHKKIAVNEASASQVSAFGSITHSMQVYQTPTLLLINKRGRTSILSGLTDAYAIEQAIDEVRHA